MPFKRIKSEQRLITKLETNSQAICNLNLTQRDMLISYTKRYVDQLHVDLLHDQLLVDQLHIPGRIQQGTPPHIPFLKEQKFSCQATYLKDALEKFFKIIVKSHKPDSVRKAWDSYKVKSKFLPDENLARLYIARPPEKCYVQPAAEENRTFNRTVKFRL